jgi:hypothetical protein
MAKVLTTNSLITTIKRRAMVPLDEDTFTESDIIDIMNEEMNIHLLPLVLRVHEEYYVHEINKPLVTNQNRYDIPYRSIGNKLRDLHYRNDSGQLYEMSRVSPDHRSDNQLSYSSGLLNQFYVENNQIVLLCDQSSNTGYLSMTYFIRPNELVKDSRASIIESIDTTNGVITVISFPTHFNSTNKFDFISAKSPNQIYNYDITPVSKNSATRTLTFSINDLPKGLCVGDYIMKAEETIVPQLPTELIPILAQRTSIKMLEAMNDTEGLKNALSDLQKMEDNALTLIDSRVDGAPIKINNRSGLLRGSNNNRRRW